MLSMFDNTLVMFGRISDCCGRTAVTHPDIGTGWSVSHRGKSTLLIQAWTRVSGNLCWLIMLASTKHNRECNLKEKRTESGLKSDLSKHFCYPISLMGTSKMPIVYKHEVLSHKTLGTDLHNFHFTHVYHYYFVETLISNVWCCVKDKYGGSIKSGDGQFM